MKWILIDHKTKEILGSYPDIYSAQKDNELFFTNKAELILMVVKEGHPEYWWE